MLLDLTPCCLHKPAVSASNRKPDFKTGLHTLQVLFTITKEKLNNSWKYAMTVIILDVLQVAI